MKIDASIVFLCEFPLLKERVRTFNSYFYEHFHIVIYHEVLTVSVLDKIQGRNQRNHIVEYYQHTRYTLRNASTVSLFNGLLRGIKVTPKSHKPS